MKNINVLVIGAGLYVCGKGTEGFGTILPAIYEWKRQTGNKGEVQCVSTSFASAKEFLKKSEDLSIKTGVSFDISSYPESDLKDNLHYRKLLERINKPSCAIIFFG